VPLLEFSKRIRWRCSLHAIAADVSLATRGLYTLDYSEIVRFMSCAGWKLEIPMPNRRERRSAKSRCSMIWFPGICLCECEEEGEQTANVVTRDMFGL